MRRIVPALVILLLAVPVFARIIESNGGSLRSWDHLQHIGLAIDMARGQSVPPHPLFHAVLLAMIGGDNRPAASGMLAILLAAALAVRAWLTAGELSEARDLSLLSLVLLCLLLALAMPLPNWWGGDIYQGNVSPNVWHNPTGIFAMPFALALFLLGTRTLARPTLSVAAWTGGAMLLCVLAKPNYVLAYAPCLALALVGTLERSVRRGETRTTTALTKFGLVFGPAAIVLGAQALLLTRHESIVYLPFAVWGVYCHDHFAGSVLIGIAFPLAVVASFPRRARQARPLVLAWATLAVAVATFALFAESGDRMLHANFAWGMTLADHVLFVYSTAFLLQQRGLIRQAMCFGVLAAHAASGAAALGLYCGWK